jgi:hypothetical protein
VTASEQASGQSSVHTVVCTRTSASVMDQL